MCDAVAKDLTCGERSCLCHIITNRNEIKRKKRNEKKQRENITKEQKRARNGIGRECTMDQMELYFKLFPLLYADYTSLVSESANGMQRMLKDWPFMPYKGRNFNPRTLGKCFYFVICMISRHWFQTKLLPHIA